MYTQAVCSSIIGPKQQFFEIDERLQHVSDKSAPLTRSKGPGKFGYWFTQVGCPLRKSGFFIVTAIVSLVDDKKENGGMTPIEAMWMCIEDMESAFGEKCAGNDTSPGPLFTMDRAYSSRDSIYRFWKEKRLFLAALKAKKGGGNDEIVWNIKRTIKRMTDPSKLGSCVIHSPKEASIYEYRRTTQDLKLLHTNALEPSPKKGGKNGDSRLKTGVAVSVQAGAWSEYCRFTKGLDDNNMAIQQYSFRQQGKTHHPNCWWAHPWDYLLTQIVITTIHVHIERHWDASTTDDDENDADDELKSTNTDDKSELALMLASQIAAMSNKKAYAVKTGDRWVPQRGGARKKRKN